MRSGSPFSPLTTRWSSHTFSARVRGRSGMVVIAGWGVPMGSAVLLGWDQARTTNSATRDAWLRGPVAAAKEKASDPHVATIPPCHEGSSDSPRARVRVPASRSAIALFRGRGLRHRRRRALLLGDLGGSAGGRARDRGLAPVARRGGEARARDRKSTRLNSSH